MTAIAGLRKLNRAMEPTLLPVAYAKSPTSAEIS
jgi:hypothetical protein